MDWKKRGSRQIRLVACVLLCLVLLGCASSEATPPPDPEPTAVAEPTAVSYTSITLPISVYILDDLDGELSSQRTEDEIRTMYERVNEIWGPANIVIQVVHVERVQVPSDLFEQIMLGNFDAFYSAVNTQAITLNNQSLVNGFYLSRLFSNGIAPIGRRSFFVVDAPTVLDERVSAHEIGHVLGLHHELADETHLMYSGTDGMFLTEEEMVAARYAAQGLLDRVR